MRSGGLQKLSGENSFKCSGRFEKNQKSNFLGRVQDEIKLKKQVTDLLLFAVFALTYMHIWYYNDITDKRKFVEKEREYEKTLS